MTITASNILLTGSVLLLISIIAGKTSGRLGVPTLIFFLLVGMLAGSEGIGGIYFDNIFIAQFIGITALNFILFSGGLDTNFKSVKPILRKGIALSTIGVLITTVTVGYFVHLVLGLRIAEGLLLGAIVSSTDAAAVFSILRSRGITLKNRLGPLLELESGSNDPMSYFLTISLTAIVGQDDTSFLHLIPHFLQEFVIGAAIGYGMGRASHWIINNIKLGSEGLYPVLMLGLAMFTYSATDFIGGNGFLAIYLCALVLGSKDFIHKRSLIKFYDGQAWLMQIILFLTLGLLVFPSKIIPVIGIGLLISAFLIFVARPIGVFISLSFFKMDIRSKVFLSWVGLRGAVPIVFATYPLLAGLEQSDLIFNLAFFISVTSVILQGTTLPIVARWLHLSIPLRNSSDDDANRYGEKKKKKIEFILDRDSQAANKKIVDLGLSHRIQIISIERNKEYIIPTGSTKLLSGDLVTILADDEAAVKKIGHLIPKEEG